jgi:hypothetical protein
MATGEYGPDGVLTQIRATAGMWSYGHYSQSGDARIVDHISASLS